MYNTIIKIEIYVIILYKDIVLFLINYLNNNMRSKKEKTDNSYKNNNQLCNVDYDDNDYIVVLTRYKDLFKSNTIKIKTCKADSILNIFPNALLIEDKKITPKIIETPQITKKNKINPKVDDVWNIIENLELTNSSDRLSEIKSDSYDKSICKGCGAIDKFIEDQSASAIYCTECGLMSEELLDHGPEWRQYSDDSRADTVGRCGCPSNFFFPKSSQGTSMAGVGNLRLKRKQTWNSMIYKEISLNGVFELITKICTKNKIPKIIIDTAKIMYKKINDCKHKSGINAGKQVIIRGENRTSIIAACVFKACETNKSPRSVKEIANYFDLDEKKITKGNKQFDKLLKNSDDKKIIMDQFNGNTAEDYIRRHCSKLKFSQSEIELAVKISNNCCKMKLAADHNPSSIAAGSILLMIEQMGSNIDRKDVAKVFSTSDVTIGKIYNKISMYSNALSSNKLTNYLIDKLKING